MFVTYISICKSCSPPLSNVQAQKMTHLWRLLSEHTSASIFCLADVGKLLRKLIGKHHDEIYQNDNDIKMITMLEDVKEPLENEISFPKPFRELFLWAVLMNRSCA